MTINLENTGIMRLERGAMQNWSDLEEFGAHVAPALRSLVGELLTPGARVLVLGSTAMDFVTELADIAGELTVLSRSIPDCATYAAALVNCANAQVVCGDLLNLEDKLEAFDLVVAVEDLARVPSLEDASPTWLQVWNAVQTLVRPGGRLILAVENELGLHRITSLRSPYTDNDNASWDVTATYDASRPRSREALARLLRENGSAAEIADLFPTWEEHTLLVWGSENLSRVGRQVLASLTMSSPALRRLGADPTRVTRAAVLADRLPALASGWLVVAGGPAKEAGAGCIVVSTSDGGVDEYVERAGEVKCGERAISAPADAALFGELLLDACASGDAAQFRRLVQEWWAYAGEQGQEGQLPPTVADLRFDNLLRGPQGIVPVASASDEAPLADAGWRAVVDFVAVIRARGSRHLWPSATDDRTMVATIGAMAGMPTPENLDSLVKARQTQVGLPARDMSGLLAVIERLEEKNAALASRANWFENRLNQRERELHGRAKRQAAELALAGRQQEELRKSAEDLRRSLTYRLGNVAMGPLKEAKKRISG